MKLRIRVHAHTCRLEIDGEDPRVQELHDLIRDSVLSSVGLSGDSEFSLSLNGSELLSESDETLSSCGIVSGDLITVVLPDDSRPSTSSAPTPTMDATTSGQPSSSAGAPKENVETPEDAVDLRTPVPSWEPMMCSEAQDGQAPLSLERLYYSALASCPVDALMVAGHLLMIETGFVPQAGELPGEMPAGWRSGGGVFRLQYTHPLCGDSVTMVTGVSMGPTFVINTSLKVNESIIPAGKLCLNPSSYVTDEWPDEAAAAAFKDLSKLSRVFKDQLAYRLLATAREAMDLPVIFGLAALPPEILLRIIRLLDIGSVVKLSSVSRPFHVATADWMLWRYLYRRDFTDSGTNRSRDTDWRELYKKTYKLCCERRRSTRQRSLPACFLNPPSIFLPDPLHPTVPGIIGGEYDMRPDLPRGVLPSPRYDPIVPTGFGAGRPQDAGRRARRVGGRAMDARRGFI